MKNFLICLGLALLAGSGYLLLTGLATAPGFPLDDGWIHQVFARNLAQHFEFSYNPGSPVAGSTSPLWTFLLVPGHWLPNFYLAWTYGLGILFLALTAHECFQLGKYLTDKTGAGWAAALFAIFEWRLTWASVSGMETLLFAWGTLLFIRLYCRLLPLNSPPPTITSKIGITGNKSFFGFGFSQFFWLGLLGGGLAFVRPEGIFLPALAGLDMLFRTIDRNSRQTETGKQENTDKRQIGRNWLLYGAGGLASVVPYFIFNYRLSGSPLPNTFGAKANYYAGNSTFDYLRDAFFQLFLVGPLFVLVPGLVMALFSLRRTHLDWRGLVWVGALVALYAWRLPVTYHHARYLLPLIPLLGIYGVAGTTQILDWLRSQKMPVVARSLPALLGLAVLVGWFNGIAAYRFDVKYINDEQVAVGKWLAQNSPPNALLATHDIGAITFFSQRRLVDTAGLVSPEFVPIVRDQNAILKLVREKGVTYFALLPNWYSEINAELEKTAAKVFEPQEEYLAQFGERNMIVYKLG